MDPDSAPTIQADDVSNGIIFTRSSSQPSERRRKTAMCDFSRRFSLNLIQQQQRAQKTARNRITANLGGRYSIDGHATGSDTELQDSRPSDTPLSTPVTSDNEDDDVFEKTNGHGRDDMDISEAVDGLASLVAKNVSTVGTTGNGPSQGTQGIHVSCAFFDTCTFAVFFKTEYLSSPRYR